MTIEICLLVWNILLIGNFLSMGNLLLIGNTLLIRYILLLSSINFGTEISKRLLLRGPDGHWGSRHYTVRLFILCGYIFSEYVMNRKNSKCNQCDFSSHHARVLSRHIKHGKIAKLPWYHNFGLSWYCQWGHSCCRSCSRTWGLSWHCSWCHWTSHAVNWGSQNSVFFSCQGSLKRKS